MILGVIYQRQDLFHAHSNTDFVRENSQQLSDSQFVQNNINILNIMCVMMIRVYFIC